MKRGKVKEIKSYLLRLRMLSFRKRRRKASLLRNKTKRRRKRKSNYLTNCLLSFLSTHCLLKSPLPLFLYHEFLPPSFIDKFTLGGSVSPKLLAILSKSNCYTSNTCFMEWLAYAYIFDLNASLALVFKK